MRSPGSVTHSHSATSAADDAALEKLLERADHALATGALVAPPAENAADLFREALRLSARDPRAVSGLEQVIDRLLADADAQLQAHHLEAAQQLADAARAISPNHPRVAFLSAQIGAQRERLVLSKAQRAAASGDVSSALAVLDDASRGGEHRSTLVDEARQQLAQKQVDARVSDFLNRAHEALAAGAVLQPPEANARFFIESARALAPNNTARAAGARGTGHAPAHRGAPGGDGRQCRCRRGLDRGSGRGRGRRHRGRDRCARPARNCVARRARTRPRTWKPSSTSACRRAACSSPPATAPATTSSSWRRRSLPAARP